jgi:glycolate oxidase FAD binding subunit
MAELMTPGSEAALIALVERAGQEGIALAVEGAGTKRHFGPGPAADAKQVSLRGLSRVTAHDVGDMILSVEAGARLADVQALLAPHGQWLPIDPPFVDEGATIGGVLATASSGPRRLGYGTVKDLLLGVRVLGAHGRVTKSGGRVVKNVSGYDLHRPQVGAYGTLGVIVEAHFKVAARPEVSAIWAVPRATLAEAHGILLEIAATALRPVALEAVDAVSAGLLRARAPELPGEPGLAVALVGIEGSRPSFERHARDLASFAAHGEGAAVLLERPASEPLWRALAQLPAATRAEVRVRVGARPRDLPEVLAALDLPRAPVRGASVRAGVGLAFLSLACDGDAAVLAPLVARWHRLASTRGGYAVVESAPLDLPGRAQLPFGAGAPSRLGTALRRAWDPRETLNPGRIVP